MRRSRHASTAAAALAAPAEYSRPGTLAVLRGRANRRRTRPIRARPWPERPVSEANRSGNGAVATRAALTYPRGPDDASRSPSARPSSRSDSDTRHSSKSKYRMILTRMHTPATITSARPGCSPGIVDPIGQGLGGQRAEDVLGGLLRQPEMMDPVTVVGVARPNSTAATGGDRPGHAHEPAGAAERGNGPHRVVEVELGDRQARRELLGLWRVVVDVLLGEPHAADVERQRIGAVTFAEGQLGRPPADVDYQEGPVGRVQVAHRTPEGGLGLVAS